MADMKFLETLEEVLLERGFPLITVHNVLETVQTIDAAEVVRCKNCKHQEDCIRRIQFWGRNPILELNTYEYHPLEFCSYGERKEDGDK